MLCQMSTHYSPVVALDGHPKHLYLLLCQCVLANQGFWDISCSREASGKISRQGSVHKANKECCCDGCSIAAGAPQIQIFLHLATRCSTRVGSPQSAVHGARQVLLPACHRSNMLKRSVTALTSEFDFQLAVYELIALQDLPQPSPLVLGLPRHIGLAEGEVVIVVRLLGAADK